MTTALNSRKVSSSSGPGYDRVGNTKDHDKYKDLLGLIIGVDRKDSFEKLLSKSSKTNANPTLGYKLGLKLRSVFIGFMFQFVFLF